MKDDIILCFCEDLTREEIRTAIKNGARTFDELKRLIRCGMGACQGKTCEDMIQREIMDITGQKRDELPLPRRRPPSVGISIDDAGRGDADEE